MSARRAVAAFLIAMTYGVAFAQAQQAPQEARLLVTIMDPRGAVLQNATVTLAGLEAATKKAAVAPVKSNEKGLAIWYRTFYTYGYGEWTLRASCARRRPRSRGWRRTWRSRATGADPYLALNRKCWRGLERAAKRRCE